MTRFAKHKDDPGGWSSTFVGRAPNSLVALPILVGSNDAKSGMAINGGFEPKTCTLH